MASAWSLDQLGRRLQDLMRFLSELYAMGVHSYLLRQGLDTSALAGRAMFQILAMFAEFERAIMRERVIAGVARARENGRRLAPPDIGSEGGAAVRTASAKGKGIRKIVSDLG